MIQQYELALLKYCNSTEMYFNNFFYTFIPGDFIFYFIFVNTGRRKCNALIYKLNKAFLFGKKKCDCYQYNIIKSFLIMNYYLTIFNKVIPILFQEKKILTAPNIYIQIII